MASRRMISLAIIDCDHFLEMSAGAQLLYFHLAIRGDDDGFINNPMRLLKLLDAKKDDLKTLIDRGYIIPFETGIVVITHWRMHNTLKKDRYKSSIHTKERALLCVSENGKYTLELNEGIKLTLMSPNEKPNGTTLEPQYSQTQKSKKKNNQKQGKFKFSEEDRDRLHSMLQGEEVNLIASLEASMDIESIEQIHHPFEYICEVARAKGMLEPFVY